MWRRAPHPGKRTLAIAATHGFRDRGGRLARAAPEAERFAASILEHDLEPRVARQPSEHGGADHAVVQARDPVAAEQRVRRTIERVGERLERRVDHDVRSGVSASARAARRRPGAERHQRVGSPCLAGVVSIDAGGLREIRGHPFDRSDDERALCRGKLGHELEAPPLVGQPPSQSTFGVDRRRIVFRAARLELGAATDRSSRYGPRPRHERRFGLRPREPGELGGLVDVERAGGERRGRDRQRLQSASRLEPPIGLP